MFRRFFFAVVFLFGQAAAAMAEKRVALILATEDYRNLRALSNPVNDARAMEDMLKALGFEVWTETDRDLRRMRRALEDFRLDGAGADLALVFYAGHGVAIDGVNYLLPTDAEAKSVAGLKDSALPLSEVQETLAAVSQNAVFLLDACRDDPFAGQGTPDPDGRGAVALADDPPEAPKPVPGLGRIGRADGVVFAFAAAPGETASDGTGKNSPFTAALLRHFATKGVELKSALTLVQQDVYDRSRGKQLPYIESGLPRLLYITDKGDLPERELLLLAMSEFTPELRAEVEEMAAVNDMPLAPLYRAMISGNLKSAPAEDRRGKLEEAARAYMAFQSDLMKYASDDPRVADLRAKAEELAALGSQEGARALLTEAAGIDAQARVATRETNIIRTLSEASTHVMNANVARTALRYDLAIGDLTRAAELYTEVRADLPDREAKLAYAVAMGDLGDLYQVAGNSYGALGAYLSQVDFLEAMSRAEPADTGWQRELIWARQAVGEVMIQQGHLREAEDSYIRAYEAALALRSQAPDDPELMREAALLSNSHGLVRYLLADYQAALVSHEEAREIFLLLLDLNPDSVTALRDVSFTHERIGDVHAAMGDYESARAAFDVSLELTQRLADRFPDDQDLRRDLSVSLERLGDMMFAEADYDTALAIYNEALRIREDLAELDPGNTRRRRDSSVTWERIGDIHLGMGDVGSAMMAYQHSMGLRESLSALDPQNAVWLRDLSNSWEKFGELHMKEGDPAGALEAFGKSRELREAMVAIDPGNLPRRRDLAVAYGKMALASMATGDFDAALALFQQALDLRRSLVESDGGVAQYRRDVASSLVDIGDLWLGFGDAATARGYFDEAIALREALLAEMPADHLSMRELAGALNLQIEALVALNEAAAAVPLGQRSVSLMEQIAAMRPLDPLVPGERVISANRLGQAFFAAGDLPSALRAYRDMAALAWEISSKDPWSVPAARDYAFALEKAGEVLMAMQDYPAARAEFEAGVALRRWIAGQVPDSPDDQRNLGYALRQLADSWYFEGNYEQGRPIEEQSLAIMRWIAGTHPENAMNLVELASGLYRASFYYQDGSLLLQEAIGVLEALEAGGRMPEGPYRDWIALYRERLEGL